MPEIPVKEETIRKVVEEIFNSQEFSKTDNLPSLSFLFDILSDIGKRILKFISDVLGKFLPQVNNFDDLGSNGNNPLFFYVGIAGAVILLLVAGFIIYKSRNIFKKNVKRKIEEDEDLLVSVKDYKYVEELSQKSLLEGDYNKAIRYTFIAMLLFLNEKGLIEIEKSKTNRQYVQELEQHGIKLIPEITTFTHLFNIYWYGQRKAKKEHYEECRGISDRVMSEVAK